MSRIPAFYRQIPGLAASGVPLNWRDDITGQLPAAVGAYLSCAIDSEPMTADQLELVREYLEHYINAPCWLDPAPGHDENPFHEEILKLRQDVKTLRSPEEIGFWMHKCLNVGLDPL